MYFSLMSKRKLMCGFGLALTTIRRFVCLPVAQHISAVGRPPTTSTLHLNISSTIKAFQIVAINVKSSPPRLYWILQFLQQLFPSWHFAKHSLHMVSILVMSVPVLYAMQCHAIRVHLQQLLHINDYSIAMIVERLTI